MNAGFPERLDFLMSLTQTTNSALARELSFDTSYICRIRNGKRGIPHRQPFIEPAAAYLAKRTCKPYQMRAVERELGLAEGTLPAPDRMAALLVPWLSEGALVSARLHGQQNGSDSMDVQSGSARRGASGDAAVAEEEFARFDMESGLESPSGRYPARFGDAADRDSKGAGGLIEAHAGYGIGRSGKRAVTEAFLARLVEDGTPRRLLLHSDESMDWLTEDPAFMARWSGLLETLLDGGSSIVVVHTVTREVGEMHEAVSMWIPLYLSGRVESFYLARIRDGICRRTLFAAEGALAVTSGSIGDVTRQSVVMLHEDPNVVESYCKEAHNLLALCRPLISKLELADEDAVAQAVGAMTADAARLRVFCRTPDGLFEGFSELVPKASGIILDEAFAGAEVLANDRMSEDSFIIVNDRDGFLLVHVADPCIGLFATERLVVAALQEYFGLND